MITIYRLEHPDTNQGPFHHSGHPDNLFPQHNTLADQADDEYEQYRKVFKSSKRFLFAWRTMKAFRHFLSFDSTRNRLKEEGYVLLRIRVEERYVVFSDGQVVYDPKYCKREKISWDLLDKQS